LQPERDAKVELNHRNQACEVLADTGIRGAETMNRQSALIHANGKEANCLASGSAELSVD